ncbi:hypothetical protein Aperf_G00000076162 [Anoplocephala perfoliata]
MSSKLVTLGISLVFFLAFGSLYIQLPGLIGDDGIVPARLFDLSVPKTVDDFVLGIPSIIRYRNSLHLSEYHAAELLVVVGMAISFLSLVVSPMRGPLSLLLQWIFFLSVVTVCPVICNWKWTSLLIEGGFLCFLQSLKFRKYTSSTSVIGKYLIGWLLFRDAFSTGYAALSNAKYPWYNLNAMNNFLSSQVSPTPAAWYLTLLSSWSSRLLDVIVISMEIFVPFLFLIPVSGVQYISFFLKFMYHGNLMAICNDGIYNLLLLVLSFAFLPETKRKSKKSKSRGLLSLAVTVAVMAVLFYVIWEFFGLQGGLNALRITIPRTALIAHGKTAVYYTIPVACFLFVLSILTAFGRAFSTQGNIKRMMDLISVVFVALLGTGLFLASLVPFASFTDSGSLYQFPRIAYELSTLLKPFHLCNDYRFVNQIERGVMLEASQQRTTLVLEGAMSENGTWKELTFHHVPSAPDKTPSIIPGHFPVLDFEVAISGDRTFENSPVLATLVYRVLTNQREVLPLIEPTGFPVGPKFIKIKKYNYRLTDSTTSSHWWTRKLQNIYLPPTTASTPRLTQLMNKLGITGKRRQRPVDPNVISTTLDKLRALVGQPANLNGFYVVLAVVLLLNKLFF